MSLTIVQGPTQTPVTGVYEGSDTTAMVLYNPLQNVEIPALPPAWITVHQSAVANALAAGATTFAISKLSGQLMTYSLVTGVRLSGTVLAEGARFLSGDGTGNYVQSQANSFSGILQSVGDTCTNVTSMVASSAVAAVAGATTMFGSMCYSLYQTYKPVPVPAAPPTQQVASMDSYDYEFVVCDVKPLLSPELESRKAETENFETQEK